MFVSTVALHGDNRTGAASVAMQTLLPARVSCGVRVLVKLFRELSGPMSLP